MINRKLIWLHILSVVLSLLTSCHRKNDEGRIEILPNPFLSITSQPKILARDLHNPMSPRLFEDRLVFSQSGRGEVNMVSPESGRITSLITGFGLDTFGGYTISAQGIAIDPKTHKWIVCAAAGAGRVLVLDPATFPTDVKSGREIPIVGAIEDNPFAAVLVDDNLIVSSGTKAVYRTPFEGDPDPLKPVFQVDTGLIGLTVDPVSGDIFGAVFGTSQKDGSIIRFSPDGGSESVHTIATGFNNLVDVAFTPEGVLLVLEFGEFGVEHEGAISLVATDGSRGITPFIKGLNNPSGIFVGHDRRLLITEFGDRVNGKNGTIISVGLAAVRVN